jgi:hypothetical protein
MGYISLNFIKIPKQELTLENRFINMEYRCYYWLVSGVINERYENVFDR